jgi:hypothetical protein
MKTRTSVISILFAITLFSSCCEENKKDLAICKDNLAKCQDECIEIAPQEGSNFVLSLNLSEDPKKNRFQTVYVESPTNNSGNIYALGAQFSFEGFDGDTYVNVKMDSLILRRLAGDSFKIKKVFNPKYFEGQKEFNIDIIIVGIPNDTNKRDQSTYTGDIYPIEKLGVGDLIRIRVFENERLDVFTGPKIWELYVK